MVVVVQEVVVWEVVWADYFLDVSVLHLAFLERTAQRRDQFRVVVDLLVEAVLVEEVVVLVVVDLLVEAVLVEEEVVLEVVDLLVEAVLVEEEVVLVEEEQHAASYLV